MKLSKANIANFFASNAVACATRAQDIAETVSPDVDQTKAVAACKALLTREKRLEALSALSDAALGLLYAQIKQSESVTVESIAKSASYGLDKVIELLEALAADQRLTMRSDKDNKRNIALALDWMNAKQSDSITSLQLFLETGHAGYTQTNYIRRTLEGLGIVKRSQYENADNWTIKFTDSPITDKIRAIYS